MSIILGIVFVGSVILAYIHIESRHTDKKIYEAHKKIFGKRGEG